MTANAAQNEQYVTAAELSDEELIANLWRAGELSWKLDAHQLEVYDQYQEWAKKDPGEDDKGSLRRIFVMDIARRFGKTFLVLIILFEICIRSPGLILTYATAWAKDIGEIILPLTDEIVTDAPDDVRPRYRTSSEGRRQGLYFPNGSVLRLVGIDVNPRGLRGRASDGYAVSEAGHVKNLKKTVTGVIYPQFQRKPKARMILESNAPEDIGHDFDTIFVADAKLRGAYVFKTIDDNIAIDPIEKAEFIAAAGGRGNPTCEREYYGKRGRDTDRAVCPEFDPGRHVQLVPIPSYADCYVSLDPGSRDLCAILWGYWHFERAQLVIQSAWAERNAGVDDIGQVILERETRLWSNLKRYSKEEYKSNPYLRVSDVAPLLRKELWTRHGIRVANVNKQIGAQRALREANLHSIRTAFSQDKIIIEDNEETKPLVLHIQNAEWNEQRTDYQRSEVFGHFDLLDCLEYLWRSVRRNKNAFPPALVDVSHDDKPIQHQQQLGKIFKPDLVNKMFDALSNNNKVSPLRPKNRTWSRKKR